VLLLKGYEYERLQKNIGGYASLRSAVFILIETLALTQKALKNVHMLTGCNDCARRRDYKKRKYVS
jgi:hypothetical protein